MDDEEERGSASSSRSTSRQRGEAHQALWAGWKDSVVARRSRVTRGVSALLTSALGRQARVLELRGALLWASGSARRRTSTATAGTGEHSSSARVSCVCCALIGVEKAELL